MSRMMKIREVDQSSSKAGLAVDQYTDLLPKVYTGEAENKKPETSGTEQRGQIHKPVIQS